MSTVVENGASAKNAKRTYAIVFRAILCGSLILILIGAICLGLSQTRGDCPSDCTSDACSAMSICTNAAGYHYPCQTTSDCTCGFDSSNACIQGSRTHWTTNWSMHWAGVALLVIGCVFLVATVLYGFRFFKKLNHEEYLARDRADRLLASAPNNKNNNDNAGAQLVGMEKQSTEPEDSQHLSLPAGTAIVTAGDHAHSYQSVDRSAV